MQTFFMINVDYFFVINVVDLTLTNCKAHQYYILCEIITNMLLCSFYERLQAIYAINSNS